MSIDSPNNDNSRSDISIGKFCFIPLEFFQFHSNPFTKKEKSKTWKMGRKELKRFKVYSCTLFLVVLK